MDEKLWASLTSDIANFAKGAKQERRSRQDALELVWAATRLTVYRIPLSSEEKQRMNAAVLSAIDEAYPPATPEERAHAEQIGNFWIVRCDQDRLLAEAFTAQINGHL